MASRQDVQNITDEQLKSMLLDLETGLYRKGTVFSAHGFSKQACYMREARDPEFAAAVERAMAVGEMKQCKELHDHSTGAKKGGDWRGIERGLRWVHRMVDAVEEQKILESQAQAKALEQAASSDATALDEAQWRAAAATLGLGVVEPK